MITIEILNASFCRLLKNERHYDLVWKILSYNVKFRNKYKKGRLDTNKQSFFSRRDGTFGLGLLPYVEEQLQKQNEKYRIDWKCEQKRKLIKEGEITLKNKILENYQKIPLKLIDQGIKRGIIKSSTGCLTGDTLIRMNRAARGFEIPLKVLYKKFNNLNYKNKRWNLAIPTMVRSFDGISIQLHQIDNVIFSGVKKVYELELENGFSIKGTFDHKIMTKEGWVELGKLRDTNFVMCDNLYPEKSNKSYNKAISTMIRGLDYHPYASKVFIKRGSIETNQIEIHRAIYEAHINNLSLEEYINILRTNKNKSKNLTFIDPYLYDVHHIDLNHYNNDPKNLIHLDKYEHQRIHGQLHYKNFNQGVPFYSRVKSIKYVGKKPTYDIQCQDPYNNFVANGMVVHNSGKSTMAGAIIKKLNYPNTLIVVPTRNIGRNFQESLKKDLGLDIGFVGDNEENWKRITVCLYQSLSNYDLEEINKVVQLILVDEIHLAIDSIVSILQQLTNCWFRFGLSATPVIRSIRKKWMQITGQMGPIITNITDKQTNKRVINDLEIYMLKFEEDSLREDYMDIYRHDVLLNERRCENLIKLVNFAFTRLKVKNCLLLVDEFEQAKKLASICKKYKDIPKPVLAWSGSDTTQILKDINSNKIPFVIGTTVFAVGSDTIPIECICLGSARKSISNLIQRLGRARRRIDEKDKTYVLDSYDIIHTKEGKNWFEEYSLRRYNVYKRKKSWKIQIEDNVNKFKVTKT